ncbi:hypothetical protein E4T39_02280 [Aureobasidium subglaciale]|nr:hypothetical protein E4T39_02280 [Aureobasidium subglaciale]
MSRSEIAAAMEDLLAMPIQPAVVSIAAPWPPTRIKYSANRRQELIALMSRFLSIQMPLSRLGVPHVDGLSEKQRATRTRFETLFLDCLSRDSICSTKLKVEHEPLSGSTITDLRPNSKNARMLKRLLRQDDCAMNPYLTWNCHEVMAALKQRQVFIAGLETMSSFKCRTALQEADEQRSFRFLDLPKEVRMLIYEDAVLKEVDWVVRGSSKPALLSVSRLIQQEASVAFFKVNRFQLHIYTQGLSGVALRLLDYPSPSSGLHRAELQWFTVMGVDNLAKIRHLSFTSKPNIMRVGQKTELDLLCLQATTCRTSVGTACSCGKGCKFQTQRSLSDELASQYKQLEYAKTTEYAFISAEMTLDAMRQIARLKTRIANLQEAMERFGRLCGAHKRVKPSAEGLELLARAVYLECSD